MSSISILTEIIDIFQIDYNLNIQTTTSANPKNNVKRHILSSSQSRNKNEEHKQISWDDTVLKDEINTTLSMKDIKQLLINRDVRKKNLKRKKQDLIHLLKCNYSVHINKRYKNMSPKQLICELKLRGLPHKTARKSELINRLNGINIINNKNKKKNKKKHKEITPLKFIVINNNKISCSQCPTSQRVKYWYDEQSISDIVSLIRCDEPNCYVIQALCSKLKINWHNFPISGVKKLTSSIMINFIHWQKNNDAINLWKTVECVVDIIKKKENRNIVIHCAAGQHRTGLAMYLILRRLGFDKNKTLNNIQNIRPITYTELMKDRNPKKSKYKKTRRSYFNDKNINTLTDFAEAFFKHQYA